MNSNALVLFVCMCEWILLSETSILLNNSNRLAVWCSDTRIAIAIKFKQWKHNSWYNVLVYRLIISVRCLMFLLCGPSIKMWNKNGSATHSPQNACAHCLAIWPMQQQHQRQQRLQNSFGFSRCPLPTCSFICIIFVRYFFFIFMHLPTVENRCYCKVTRPYWWPANLVLFASFPFLFYSVFSNFWPDVGWPSTHAILQVSALC